MMGGNGIKSIGEGAGFELKRELFIPMNGGEEKIMGEGKFVRSNPYI